MYVFVTPVTLGSFCYHGYSRSFVSVCFCTVLASAKKTVPDRTCRERMLSHGRVVAIVLAIVLVVVFITIIFLCRERTKKKDSEASNPGLEFTFAAPCTQSHVTYDNTMIHS